MDSDIKAEDLSLPRGLYFTAQDAPHWSRLDPEEGSTRVRAPKVAFRNHLAREVEESVRLLLRSLGEARSVDATGITDAAAEQVERRAQTTSAMVAQLVLDIRAAAHRYRCEELAASRSAAPVAFDGAPGGSGA